MVVVLLMVVVVVVVVMIVTLIVVCYLQSPGGGSLQLVRVDGGDGCASENIFNHISHINPDNTI